MGKTTKRQDLDERVGRIGGDPVWLEGSQWRGGHRWEVYSFDAGVLVVAYGGDGRFPVLRKVWRTHGSPWVNVRSREAMVNKYIAAARASVAGSKKTAITLDGWLAKGRPAITAFMTETDAGGGQVRELSVLMIAVGADGMRVGLKDDDQGGWCWRVAATLEGALDALEGALASGEARFGGAARRGPKKRS